MHITLVIQHAGLEVILTFCDLGKWPGMTRYTWWLNIFAHKPAFGYKTAWTQLLSYRRLLRHLKCRKCFGATAGSSLGRIRSKGWGVNGAQYRAKITWFLKENLEAKGWQRRVWLRKLPRFPSPGSTRGSSAGTKAKRSRGHLPTIVNFTGPKVK